MNHCRVLHTHTVNQKSDHVYLPYRLAFPNRPLSILKFNIVRGLLGKATYIRKRHTCGAVKVLSRSFIEKLEPVHR